jgi:hypothetical protein
MDNHNATILVAKGGSPGIGNKMAAGGLANIKKSMVRVETLVQ